MKKLIFIVTHLVLISLLTKCTGRQTNEASSTYDVDQYVNRLIQEFNIGGAIAIGIVRDNKVIAERVYGYTDFEDGKKADLDTRFYIASMTKSFVGTLMKIMEESGELSLEAPLSDYLNINFNSDVITDTMTLEDLIIHTSGLKNHTVAIKSAFTGNFSKQELLNDFEELSYQSGYGSFHYTNLGYILGGLALESHTGKHWKQLLEEKIIIPLKLHNTTSFLRPAGSTESNYQMALPHTYNNDRIITGKFMKRNDTMHAAGGLITTVGDMNTWLMAHLGESQGGLLSTDALEDIHTDRIDFYDKNAGINNYGYGLGWAQGDWNEYDISWHSGGYPGYASVHAIIREENLGVVVMMSQQSRAIELILHYILADQLNVDNTYQMAEMEENIKYRIEEQKNYKDSLSRMVKDADVELARYEGVYTSESLNNVAVGSSRGKLYIQFGNLLFMGEYLGDDMFLVKSEVDDTFGKLDFFHLNRPDRRPYLELFGEYFYKGQID